MPRAQPDGNASVEAKNFARTREIHSSAPEKPAVEAALPAPADFSNVQVVTFNNNSGIGFFDRSTGTLYIYDSSLTKCITIKSQLNIRRKPAQETIKP